MAPIRNGSSIVGEADYISFSSKEILGQTFSRGTVPLKVGVRHYITPGFYTQGQIGVAISTEGDNSIWKTGFLYAPSLGVELPVADKMAVDFGARY